MAFTVANEASAVLADNVAVLGIRAYFKPTGATGGWTDMGHVRAPSREQDLTELDIQSARLGRLATIKKITTEQSLEYTFEAMTVFDQDVLALHTGGTTEEGAANVGDILSVEDFVGTEGELMFVQENAETGNMVKIAYYPKAQIKGDGEESGDGESVATLSFRGTVLQDEAYVVPAGLAAGTPAAPYGFRYFTPEANLSAVLDIIDPTV